jgi:hypothetical protein
VEDTRQDCFVVFVRDGVGAGRPEVVEQVVATCPSYEDADRVRQELRGSGRHCVIRCVGQSGGGD